MRQSLYKPHYTTYRYYRKVASLVSAVSEFLFSILVAESRRFWFLMALRKLSSRCNSAILLYNTERKPLGRLYLDVTHTTMTQWTPERWHGYPRYWLCMSCIIIVVMSSRLQVQYIMQPVEWQWLAVSRAPSLAGFRHKKSLPGRPFPPDKLIKTQIRVNPIACSDCDVYEYVIAV